MRPGQPSSRCAVAAPCGAPAMASEDFDPARMLTALWEADVRFVLVGGMAAILHGDVGVTIDLDVVPEREPENLDRLAIALRALDARIRTEDAPEGLLFDCSGAFFRNLAPDAILNLTTQAGDLDLTFRPSGTEGYADLRRDAIGDRGGRRRPPSRRLARRRDSLQGSRRPRKGSNRPAAAASAARPDAGRVAEGRGLTIRRFDQVVAGSLHEGLLVEPGSSGHSECVVDAHSVTLHQPGGEPAPDPVRVAAVDQDLLLRIRLDDLRDPVEGLGGIGARSRDQRKLLSTSSLRSG